MSEGVQFLLPKAKALEALCKPRSEMLNVKVHLYQDFLVPPLPLGVIVLDYGFNRSVCEIDRRGGWLRRRRRPSRIDGGGRGAGGRKGEERVTVRERITLREMRGSRGDGSRRGEDEKPERKREGFGLDLIFKISDENTSSLFLHLVPLVSCHGAFSSPRGPENLVLGGSFLA
ncbi:hypothetical protein Scep_012854 [Stephania cephalantha]|uniref:Uncharacterized protein n=1 Tax=Stephania cephalantha TaxID=152367 RepID=A0AAP0JFW9_9MAGN